MEGSKKKEKRKKSVNKSSKDHNLKLETCQINLNSKDRQSISLTQLQAQDTTAIIFHL